MTPDIEALARRLTAPMWTVEPVDLRELAAEAAAALRELSHERDVHLMLLRQGTSGLVAERDALQARTGTLNGEVAHWKDQYVQLHDTKGKLQAERDALQARVRELEVYEAAFRELQSRYEALRAECEGLKREVEILRQYGNKDCTDMADAAMAREKA